MSQQTQQQEDHEGRGRRPVSRKALNAIEQALDQIEATSAAETAEDSDGPPTPAYSWILPSSTSAAIRATSPSTASSATSSSADSGDVDVRRSEADDRMRIGFEVPHDESGQRASWINHHQGGVKLSTWSWLADVEAQQPSPEDRRKRIANARMALLRRQRGREVGYGTSNTPGEVYGDTLGKGKWFSVVAEVYETEADDADDGVEACRDCGNPWQAGLLTLVVLCLLAMALWVALP